MLWLLSGPPGFTCWVSFAPVFSFIFYLLSLYLCFISFLYLDLYVLGDDALISFFRANQTSMCLDQHLN